MGLFSGIKKAFKKVVKGVKKVFKKIGKGFKKLMGKKWFRTLLFAASVITGGMALVAGFQGFAASTAPTFLGKFVAGAKDFMAVLANPVKTAKAGLGGQSLSASARAAQAAQGSGNLANQILGTEQALGAGAPSVNPVDVLSQGGDVGTALSTDLGAQAAGQGAFATNMPGAPQALGGAAPNVMAPAAADTGGMLMSQGGGGGAGGFGSAMGGATGAPVGAGTSAATGAATVTTPAAATVPTATTPAASGHWLSKAGNVAKDFVSSTGGGLIVSGALQGWGKGVAAEEAWKQANWGNRMWAKEGDQYVDQINQRTRNLDVPRGLSQAMGDMGEQRGRDFVPRVQFRPAVQGG